MLNLAANALCRRLLEDRDRLRVGVVREPGGATIIDCGIAARGGLEAGRALAEVCLAGLGQVNFVPGDPAVAAGPWVQVRTDAPVLACMASQYAGWAIQQEKFFAMGSGPMRAAAAKEPLFEKINYREQTNTAVGVLETRKIPPKAVCQQVAQSCNVPLDRLTLLAAPTASQAGGVQVVARSVETALHKLLELGFDLSRIDSGYGIAPLPPVARNDLAAIGRTNDAVLYGAQVTLWVRGDDESLEAIGPRVPSSASADSGAPFAEIFARYGGDFYKIDPLLFSPAEVTLMNLDTGRTFRYGATRPDLLARSFQD